MYKVEFLEDYSVNKKGEVKEFSRDIANMLVFELKICKFVTEQEVKTVKPKKEKE